MKNAIRYRRAANGRPYFSYDRSTDHLVLRNFYQVSGGTASDGPAVTKGKAPATFIAGAKPLKF